MPEWGERQPDGSVIVYNNDSGTPVAVRHESFAENQGQPAAGGQPASVPGATVVGGEQPFTAGQTPGTYRMADGRDYTIEQMRAELAAQDPSWATAEPYKVVIEYGRLKDIAAGRGDSSVPGSGQDRARAAPGGPGSVAPGGAAPGAAPGAGGLQALIDATIYANTMDALQRYALAKTAEERQQAYLDLQRWTQELSKTQFQQKQYTDVAQAILSAGTQLSSRPEDYAKFNQVVSGGRDIFDVMSGKSAPGAAFGGPAGHVRAGSAEDLLARLGIQYPATSATPAGVLPGAASPSVLPNDPRNLPAPGGAPGSGGGGVPTYEQMLKELDIAAGGNWRGDRANRDVVKETWWRANPARRGTPVPGWA
jgi:hypothetical protein